jgi:hypothetical protein
LIELKSQVNQLSIEADILRQKYLNARVQWQAQEIMVNLEQTREEADDHFKENKSMKKQLNEADQQVNKVKTERRPSTSSNEPTASSCRLDFNYPSPNRIGSLERISFPIAKSTPTNQDEMTVSGRLDNTDDLITEDEPMILASRNITFEYIDYLY